MSSAIPKPFKISIPQEKVNRPKQQLSPADLPDELENSGWDYGVPLSDMKRLVKAWREWDWRKAEKALNQVPMYTMDVPVDGYWTLDIHIVYQKSEIKGAIPLLVVHGSRFRHETTFHDPVALMVRSKGQGQDHSSNLSS
jgi:hypothetical protein